MQGGGPCGRPPCLHPRAATRAHKHYYLFDGLGSIVGVTKGDGSKENSYDYDPYGIMLHQTEGVSNPWKFAGGFLDSSTSLYKFGTRYDDPTLGRWTQQDPVAGSLGNPDSLNRYLYAKDNPVNFTDPSGAISCVDAIVLAIIAVYGAADFGEVLATAALAAVAGPLGLLLALAIAAVAIYGELLAVNSALDACGLSQYDFPLP